jgi:hypothetical protein
MTTSSITGLSPWERVDFIAKSDEELPDWLVQLWARHVAAVDTYVEAVSAVVGTQATIETAGRAHRRAVRDAVAAGRPAPKREDTAEVEAAQIDVGQEDAYIARLELAITSAEILQAIRSRIGDFGEDLYIGASPELRIALGGWHEYERLRRERQINDESEAAIVDLSRDDPLHADYNDELGQEAAANAA